MIAIKKQFEINRRQVRKGEVFLLNLYLLEFYKADLKAMSTHLNAH